MAETEKKAGKLVRDPEAQAIDAINRAMATLADDPAAQLAVCAWFHRKHGHYEWNDKPRGTAKE